MEKKVYSAPYLKVVSVKNNIIATSGPHNQLGNGVQLIQGRMGWDEEEEEY